VARGPKRKFADPMLFCVTGGAQRNRVAIARLHANTTIGSGSHMRGLRRRGFAAGDAGELTDKSKVLPAPTQMRRRLGRRARHRSEDAGHGHRL